MIRKHLPVLLALLGLGLGIGAGFALQPAPPAVVAGSDAAQAGAAAPATPAGTSAAPGYVKLSNQFVVPLIKDGKVSSMVIMSLSLEVTAGQTSTAFARVPKLRDSFLQVMFDHANAGGFDGSFTDSDKMVALRKALLESAQKVLGSIVTDVLITDIVRQDT
jgi:hypothetical protein